MAEGFRELEIWQEAHQLGVVVYRITKKFPQEEKYGLANQLQRAGVSVPANIAEGCGRYSNKDRIQFLIIARGSVFEAMSHLSIAVDLTYIDQKTFMLIDKRYEVLAKRINAYINHLRESA